MAIDVDEGGHRPAPGMGLALLAVLVMVMVTAILSLLIYLLMQGVAATSSGRDPGATQRAPLVAPPMTSGRPAAAPPSTEPLPTTPTQPITK